MDRLLARSDQLIDTYHDIYTKLHPYPEALKVFLGCVVNTAAFWNSDKMAKPVSPAANRSNLTLISQNKPARWAAA